MSDNTAPVRRRVLQALTRILHDGQSLSSAREPLYKGFAEGRDRAFAMRLVQGVLRWRWMLQAILDQCLDKPLRNKEHEVNTVLLMALYELVELDTPDYAAVDEAVKLVKGLRKQWARGLVNAVLRKFIRERDALLEALSDEQCRSHPEWLQQQVRDSWPDHWQQVLDNNNVIAGTHLRVNRMQVTADEYLAMLRSQDITASKHAHAADALVIDSTVITGLPGFDDGLFSVQDAGAQIAAELLPVNKGERVLDLCAAPGGKACHLLEVCDNDIDLVAVDIAAERLERIEQNFERLGLNGSVMQADAAAENWYEGELFDHILLDAPCSATGVIRRHPDIKSLRLPEDIAELAKLQQTILEQAWPLLKPGGSLLYITCSVLRQENVEQVSRFLSQHADADEQVIDVPWGIACEHGRQLLPGMADTDGFYFALIRKQA